MSYFKRLGFILKHIFYWLSSFIQYNTSGCTRTGSWLRDYSIITSVGSMSSFRNGLWINCRFHIASKEPKRSYMNDLQFRPIDNVPNDLHQRHNNIRNVPNEFILRYNESKSTIHMNQQLPDNPFIRSK